MLHNDTDPPDAILGQAPHSLPAREETTASASCRRPSGIAAEESMEDFMAITKALADGKQPCERKQPSPPEASQCSN